MNWQPPTSIASGSLVGGAVADLVYSSLTYWAHIPPTEHVHHSITVVCIFLCAWAFHGATSVPQQPVAPAGASK